MSKLVRCGAIAAVSVSLLALTPAAYAKQCREFAAVGSGVTKSIASFMALQGAINVAENRGWTVQGDAKLVGCKETGIFGMECTARSRACLLKK